MELRYSPSRSAIFRSKKHAEQEIRLVQERFELALKGADLAAWDWNIETGEVIFNARFAEMRGYRPEEVEPHVNWWIQRVHPEDWPRVKKTVDDYTQGIIPEYDTEYRARTKSGDLIWVFTQGKAFTHDKQGKPIRMVGTERDITAGKRIEWEQGSRPDGLDIRVDAGVRRHVEQRRPTRRPRHGGFLHRVCH